MCHYADSAYLLWQVAEHQKGFKDGRTGEQEITVSRQMRDKVSFCA